MTLVCVECGREHSSLRLRCDNGCDSLLRTQYEVKRFAPRDCGNLFRFIDWLPCANAVQTQAGPAVHPCSGFGRRLGLSNLFCSFGGYWPAIGACNPTGTFKDLEAVPTLAAFAEAGRRRIIVGSAGNTARAFAHAAQGAGVDVFLVVPEGMLGRLWLPGSQPIERVRLIAVEGSFDYYEAILVADEIARRYGIDPEGGARNVARRDGLGTVMLEAARSLGSLPRHYFQAIGSGTGAIAVFEAVLRLRVDERFAGAPMPRLHLSQNSPFLPIYRAWKEGTGIDAEDSWSNAREDVYASVLANRNPPYSLRGGVKAVLEGSGGDVYAVSSEAARQAAEEFSAAEGIDLEPAAAVAVASVKQAVTVGRLRAGDLVLVNLTGGGLDLLRKDFGVRPLAPDLVVRSGDLDGVAAIM
jgi:cysteate synthase